MGSAALARQPPQLRVLLSHEEIRDRVSALAQAISHDYRGQQPVLVGVLKGGFIFLADLVRALTVPVATDFVRAASYGAGTSTSGEVGLLVDVTTPLSGRPVLVVEDIVDSGITLSFLLEHLRRKGAASLKVCALLDKPARRQRPVVIDYLGFTIPNDFVVGYGLDYAERYRQLPDICVLEPCPTDP